MGRRWAGFFTVLALSCGATTRNGTPDSEVTGGTGGEHATAGHATGGNTTAGHATAGQPARPRPVAGAGGVDTESGGSSGEPGVAGEAGAGGRDPCAEIEPRCQPGEPACHPRLGKLGTCDACGAVTNVDMASADCVRELASDKESNGFCALLGADRLQCEGFPLLELTVSPDVVEVILPDDYYSVWPNEPCLRYASGRYSCELLDCDGRQVLGDSSQCSLCNGELYCTGLSSAVPNVQEPIDVSITDSAAFVLSPLGVHAYNRLLPLPADWRGAPVGFTVDHRDGGCAFSDQGEMACWVELLADPRPSSWRGTFKKIVGGTLPRACALDAARQLRCGDVFEDVTPAPWGEADVIDFVVSSDIVCSLSVAGRVKCWDLGSGQPRNEAPPDW